jgi:hypothetical protein
VSALRAPAFRYRFGIYTSQAPKLDVARELATAAHAYGLKVVSQQIGPELPPRTSTIFLMHYMLIKRDGTHEGNETQPLLDARTRARRDKP